MLLGTPNVGRIQSGFLRCLVVYFVRSQKTLLAVIEFSFAFFRCSWSYTLVVCGKQVRL